jgi:hypothetical protein
MMPQSTSRARLGRLYAGLLVLFFLGACAQGSLVGLLGPETTPARGFSLLLSPAPHAFRYAYAPEEPVRRGARSERFELRDGDCGGSDCGNPRARAEIAEDRRTIVGRLDRDLWIGWSFYNASIRSVRNETYLGTTIGQWRLSGSQPALIRFIQLAQGSYDMADCDPAFCTMGGDPAWDVVVQLDEMRQSMRWGRQQNSGNICRLFSMEQSLGRWIDIVVNTNFGTNDTGYLRIWIDGDLRCDYRGPLVSSLAAAADVPGPAHRRGIFNSFTERWSATQGGAPMPTLIVLYDEYRTGQSRLDVDPALREAAALRPVD